MCQRSCLGCVCVEDQSTPGSFDEPGYQDWVCNNEDAKVQAHAELSADACLDAEGTAASCPGFEAAAVEPDYEDDGDWRWQPWELW